MSDQQSIHSMSALLGDNSEFADKKKPGQGLKGFLYKLREEDDERKAGRIEHISYDEANKRTGYDQNGWPSEEKQMEKDKKGKGDKRLVMSLSLVG